MLIMVGDSDIVRPEHVVEMFRLVGGGVAGDLAGLPASQLAILPGTTHVTLMQQSQKVQMVLQIVIRQLQSLTQYLKRCRAIT